MATKNVSATGEKKAVRPVGPKSLFLIFKPGTDPAFVREVSDAIGEVTMNGRALIRALSGGQASPFLTYKVEAEKRGGSKE
jgi:hypothetical protein